MTSKKPRPVAGKAVHLFPARLSPATFGQERLWFLSSLAPEAAAYHGGRCLHLGPTTDPVDLAWALNRLVERHEPLRTAFTIRGELLSAVFRTPIPFQLTRTDLTGLPESTRAVEFDRIAAADLAAPFQLDQPPLWRARLVRFAEDDLRLIHVAHAAIFDPDSANIFDAELLECLAAARDRRPPRLPPLPLRFTEHAARQRAAARRGGFDTQLQYWCDTLAGVQGRGFPTSRPRRGRPSHRGAELRFSLPTALVDRLAALAAHSGTTTFAVLLCAFFALLHRYTGEPDLVVATETAGRETGLEPLVGAFRNTLLLRTDLGGDPTFLAALRRVHDTLDAAVNHRDVPFATVIEALAPERDPSRAPLCQTSFALLPAGTSQPLPDASARLDLAVGVVLPAAGAPPTTGAQIAIRYATDLFDPALINQIAAEYRSLLAAAADDPGQRLTGLVVRPDRADPAGYAAPTGPRRGYPESTLHAMVFEQAATSPQAPAVGYGGRWLTYRELTGRAGQTARWLRADGVGPGSVVGVCVSRGPDLLPTLLGVLAAGAAYLPIEPDQPPARLDLLLRDAGVDLLVTTSPLIRKVLRAAHPVAPRVRLIDAERTAIAAREPTPPASGVGPEALAYVVATTRPGRPGAVGVSHRAILNRLQWAREAFALEPTDRVLCKTPLTFDTAVWELFGPLVAGGGAVIAAPGAQDSPGYLADLVDRERVSLAHFVPSQLAAFLDHPELLGLDRVVCSGEVLSPRLVARCRERLPGVRLFNFYGPAEAAADVAWHCCAPGEASVPIGRPAANTRIEILDERLGRVPLGVAGELCIAGVQLARGYLNQPKLTARRFVADPYGPPGSRLYRTGDRALRRGDGELEFLGRLEERFPERGEPIEPEVVRSTLELHLNVDRAVVVVRADAPGGPGLVGYVRWTGQPDCLTDALRRYLRPRVPASMIPTAFVPVDQFPLLPSGKLDREALPEPPAGSIVAAGYLPPRTAAERVLCGIWAELLDRPDVGVADDFFDLGGDSLRAARMLAAVADAFGITLEPRSCFELSTVADYALAILDRQLHGTEYGVDKLIESIQAGHPAP